METSRLHADFRFTLYRTEKDRMRIVLTGAQSGRTFESLACCTTTLIVWFAMLRLYLRAASRGTPTTGDGT